MSTFNIEIANYVIEIETIHVRSFAVCRDFICNGKEPDFRVRVLQKDIDNDTREYMLLHNTNNKPWEGIIEVYTLLRKVAENLVDFDVLLMHGAAISVNNESFIFTGKSGIGKSTHVSKWLNSIEDVTVINGDKPFILIGDTPMVCGSPWAGKENMYSNTMSPLKAIIFLERSDNNCIYEISLSEAFPLLLQQVYRPRDIDKLRKTFELLKTLGDKVSFFYFKINNYKNDCFEVAYNELFKQNT